MGGEPQVALAVCGFSSDLLPLSVLERIFRGGRDTAAEAGCAVVGGHTIKDGELKYGLCVIGTVDPARALTQTHAQAGDALVLTKPLGFGIASQAIKNDALGAADLQRVTELMLCLNKSAKDAALAAGAHAATDVTGFGLLGHLRNVLVASGVAARVERAAVPVLDFVPALARAGAVPGGSKSNLAAVAPFCSWSAALEEADRLILADAQTSGGLLLTIPRDRAATLVAELTARGAPAHAIIGEITDGEPGRIEIF
jgi:selenide,water dikinase